MHGDLDAIILRGPRADPAQRYQTVDALRLDLERYRQVRPVHARPRTALYVASRFFQRHHVSLTIGLAVLMLVAVGVSAVVWQAAVAREAHARAERRFADMRAMTRVFMFDVHDAILNVPGTTDARVLIAKTGMRYLERLAAEGSPDPSLRRELAAGFVKVGDAQGNPSSPNIGDSSAARASYLRAIEIASGLTEADPSDLEAARILAMAHRRLGDVLAWMGDMTRALTHAEASAAQFHSPCGPCRVRRADYRLQAVIGQIKLGDLLGNPNLPNLGRPDAAMARYDAALATLRPLLAAAPGDQRSTPLRRAHARTHRLDPPTGVAMVGSRGGVPRIVHHPRGAGCIGSRSCRHSARPGHRLREACQRRAAGGTPRAAATYARGALARFERLANLDPANANAARSVAISREHLADMLLDLGSAVGPR